MNIDLKKFKKIEPIYGQKGRFKIKIWLNKDGEPPDEPSNSKDDKEESSSSFMGDSGDSSDGISKELVQNDDENDENSTIEIVQEKVQNNNDPSKMPSPPSLSSTVNSEEPEKCPNCDKMIDPYDKNPHPSCCSGRTF